MNHTPTPEVSSLACLLCSNPLPQHPIVENEKAFCCMGCHAVYQILSAKNELERFSSHPIFQRAMKAGIISNPVLMEQMRLQGPSIKEETKKLYLEIQEMWCPSCAEVITWILLREKGVVRCVVDYASDLASIEYSPRYLSKEKIYQLIGSLGYIPRSLSNQQEKAISFSFYLRFIISAFCALNVMMFAYPIYASYFDADDIGYADLFTWLSFGASLPVMTYGMWPIIKRFSMSLRTGIFGMESLVVMSVGAAFMLSFYELFQGSRKVYFDSMTVVVVLVLLGKIIETKAKFSAKETLLRLNRGLPRKGRKRSLDGSEHFVLLKDIVLGDVVITYSGEKIVMDGIVVEGQGGCDESLLTGEPLPVHKSIGSLIFGGAILQNGSLAFKVTAHQEESILQRIISMIEQEINKKTSYYRYVDYIVKGFVPFILMIAFTTVVICFAFQFRDEGQSVIETAITRVVSILLIACPCAIGIAVPIAEANLMSSLGKMGAIVRNRGCLVNLGKETTIVFDKTGTITEGKFKVKRGLQSLTFYQLEVLKALTSRSMHPVSCAINAALVDVKAAKMGKIEELPGKGIRGWFENEDYLLGSRDFLLQNGITIPEGESSPMHSAISFVFMAEQGHYIAGIELQDSLAAGVKEMLSKLLGQKTILLSGDSLNTVKWVANACGFSEWKARATPLDKQEFIHRLRNRGEIVCMIGDGINDAPALTAADVGISVVAAADISIQVSDILLTTDRLEVIPKMLGLARKGQRIIKQNLFWAFFYNLIGVALATLGLLSPIFAAFAMMASSIIVVLNAQRLSSYSSSDQ